LREQDISQINARRRGYAIAPEANELVQAAAACRSYFLTAAAFSLAINLLYLAPSLYMMQVYDRVIPSSSVVTLVMLTLVLLMSLAALGALDCVRAMVLTRASMRLDRLLGTRVVAATIEASVPRGGLAGMQPLKDFDSFRQCITGSGAHAAFDLPWTPIYILIIGCLHPALGFFAFVCAAALGSMALLNEVSVRKVLGEANDAAGWTYQLTDMSLRNAQVIQAMGLLPGLLLRWSESRNYALARQQVASERAAVMMAAIKFLRLAMQSGILGLGAYLAIEQMSSVGAVFAASILLGRALQPVEQIVGTWRSFVAGRAAYLRLRALLEAVPTGTHALTLPRPAGRLTVEKLGFTARGASRPILHGLSFGLEPGETCCIIGPSGAGKSTLARHLVGVVPPSTGAVRLDGADVTHYPPHTLGSHIGYLPQDIELFADTIAANIGRFKDGEDGKIVEAARIAGVHERILRLPNGYETSIGEGGAILSGGFRQRIGLARAVFGDPSFVVLDEPSSNLDTEGDAALAACIQYLKRRGTTVVIISHRPATIGLMDKLLVVQGGTASTFGPRREVLARLARSVPMHVVRGEAGGA
jgi:PrtD family type I secretion system ABC transporter